jgi:hypothetical protein
VPTTANPPSRSVRSPPQRRNDVPECRRRAGVRTWGGRGEPRTPPAPAPPIRPTSFAAAAAASPDTDRLDHFVPPEPPPLPRIGPPALVGFGLLLLGLALVTHPALVGVSDVYGLPLGLLALAAGLGWLVLRLWPAPPDERDEDDDGAQL